MGLLMKNTKTQKESCGQQAEEIQVARLVSNFLEQEVKTYEPHPPKSALHVGREGEARVKKEAEREGGGKERMDKNRRARKGGKEKFLVDHEKKLKASTSEESTRPMR